MKPETVKTHTDGTFGEGGKLSLRYIFSRRIGLLLLVFSLTMVIVVALVYQVQTDRYNRTELKHTLEQMLPHIRQQLSTYNERVNSLVNTLEWSGLLYQKDKTRNDRLRAFFTTQSDSLGVDGIILADAGNHPVFSYWSIREPAHLELLFDSNQAIWYDAHQGVLYSVFRKKAQAPGFQDMTLLFLVAWDNAMFSRLTFPGMTSYVSVDDHPVISSSGMLDLQNFAVSAAPYEVISLDHGKVHQTSKQIDTISMEGSKPLPVVLTLRAPLKNSMPIYSMIGVSLLFVLLFGVVLFFTIGRWLRELGGRLDALGHAVMNFQLNPDQTVSSSVNNLLSEADMGRNDQISLLTHEMMFLMESAALRDEEQRAYLQTLDLLQDAVIEFLPQGKLVRATSAWKLLTGIEDINDCYIEKCVHPDDVSELKAQISALTLDQKSQINIRFRLLKNGDVSAHYWVEGRFAIVKSHDHQVTIRGVVRDITHTYRQERQISHMALHDSLTNLPNRVLLEDRMEMAISRAARTGKRVALGFIDLDHFKQVNDNFGHRVGDLLLKEVTSELGNALRNADTLSRWGGDEFVVLCPDLESLEDARDITKKLSILTEKVIHIEGTDFPLIFSAGFAVYPDDASDSETLMAQADRAMFYAKAQGRNNIQFFNAIAGKETGRQSFYIQSRLASAITGQEIQAWLQPMISARSGRVVGAEVLSRWHDAEHGWVPPDVFIPMAESMGMIDRLGQHVWQQALQALAQLPADHRLSVNLSKRQLFSSNIVKQFREDVESANLSPARIMLEITEGIALSEVEYAHERIVELSRHGFGIAVDDFGVGYSSLSQLHEIPANELKLDKSFISRIHDKAGQSMVSAIISIAQSLQLETVAEGVEDRQTADTLTGMGVDILQGYYFAQAMPIGDYIRWLDAWETKER